ncbi:MAG: glycoside hydrolase family 117 protein [Puniceicoccaceae bacterium]
MRTISLLLASIWPILCQADFFPAKIPPEKPGYQVSVAVERLYDTWNPYEDRGNELYSNFKFSPIEGLPRSATISRRDPTKILKIDGLYHVWYTHRSTESQPLGAQKATDSIPSADWDLAEIWHATSKDGFTWKEHGPAVKRLPKPQYGWRSISTPDILPWKGKFYMYYQGFNEIPFLKGDRAAVTVAVADTVWGPFEPLGKVVVDFGGPEDWDSNAIHDPYPLIFKDKIYLYYKGSPGKLGKDGTLIRAQGVAIAEHPIGPFRKSPKNPVINSGHETCAFPWKDGLAAIVSLDGPEKNTVQYSPDGINWEVKSLIQVPPVAPGPFVADAYANNGDGRGITWGLCHVMDRKSKRSILMRSDCDLSLDVDRELFKRNNLRFNADTYFKDVPLPAYIRNQLDK